jgi:Beta-glucosidase-related glycosidases
MIQKYAIQNSRLHLPVIFGVDAVHGFGHPWQAPLFPQSIGMGATWDPSATEAGGAATGKALRATGWAWDFAPVQDLSRDNRWGRTYETWAEEPVCPRPWAPPTSAAFSLGSGRLARCHRDRQALRRLLPGDQRPRPQRGPAAAELPAEHDPAVVRRWH